MPCRVTAVCLSAGLGAVDWIGNYPLIFSLSSRVYRKADGYTIWGRVKGHLRLLSKQGSFHCIHCRNVCCAGATWHNQWMGCIPCWTVCVCVSVFFLHLARCCVAAAPWLASAHGSFSHGGCVYQHSSCWASITQDVLPLSLYLSRSTTFIFLFTVFRINVAPYQTQAIESCQSVSTRPDISPQQIPLEQKSQTLVCISMFHIPRHPLWNVFILDKSSVTYTFHSRRKPTDCQWQLKYKYTKCA